MFANALGEELPLILLKNFTNSVSVGLFSKGRNLGQQPRMVTMPIGFVLFPYTAASAPEDAARRTTVACRNCLLIMALSGGLVMLVAKPLISLLYGAAFLPAVPVVFVLMPGVVLWPVSYFLGIHIAAIGKPKAVFLTSLTTLVLGGVGCYLHIPRWGVIGAGLSTTLIYVIRSTTLLGLYRRVAHASVVEVLLPRWSDRVYYQRLLQIPLALFSGKVKAV